MREIEWISVKERLPEQEAIAGLKVSPYVLAIPKSGYEAKCYIPEVTRLVNDEWQFFLAKDDVVCWSPLPSIEEIGKEVERVCDD